MLSRIWTRPTCLPFLLRKFPLICGTNLPAMNSSFARLLFIVFALAAFTSTAVAKDSNAAKPVKKVTVALKDAKGNSVGSAMIKSSGKGVEVKLDVKDLPPGEHALHFHQEAKCEAPDFKSAGPHFNPDKKQHGFLNPAGHHNGDMANFTVKPNGAAKAVIKNADVVLGTGSEANSLFANGGTSLMIHAKPDDMKSDPAGNAGDRIACGTITK
jgi:superoxide dismutase, Cu-Zn family